MLNRSCLAGLFAGVVLFAAPTEVVAQAEGPGGSPPPLTAKKASAMLKKAMNGHLKFQRQETADIIKEFCDTVKLLEEDLKAGDFKVDDLMDAMINEMGVALRDLNDLHNTVVNTTNFDAEQLLVQLDSGEGFPDAFLQGACDNLDKGLDKAQQNTDTAVDKLRKKLKAFNKKAQKAGLELNAELSPPEPVSITPDPGQPSPPVIKDLTTEAMLSSSAGDVCFNGQYSGEPGVSVDVTITVDGRDFTLGATTDGCRWSVCLRNGQGLDAPLARGNYPVEVREFDVDGTLDSICTSFGAP